MQTALLQIQRDQLIVQVVREKGVASVRDLSDACAVTEVTIRRDLQRLESQGLLQRTYGGAILVDVKPETRAAPRTKTNFAQSIDVLIMTYTRTQRSHLLLEQAQQRGIPIIAESEAIEGAQYVGIDPYAASFALGEWVGQHAADKISKPVRLLDITYYFPNTRQRSQGFIDGLLRSLPAAQHVLSIDGHALKSDTYTLVKDTLAVYDDINLIFAINDDSAIGALEACRDFGLKPNDVMIAWVGLDGLTTRQLLQGGQYLTACAAMFPEIVAQAAFRAAIDHYARPDADEPIAPLFTPSAVVTRDTLADYYSADGQDMQAAAFERLAAPYRYTAETLATLPRIPESVGFVLPFNTHDWYQTITRYMAHSAELLGIDLIVEDATASANTELAWLAQNIATAATMLIKDGDTLFVDHEAISLELALQLPPIANLTVITNAIAVLSALDRKPNVRVILTGGELHPNGQALVGRIAELAIGEYHATKAFIGVAGLTEATGLSAPDHSLGQLQRAMINAARETILLADHTRIGISGQARIMPLAAGQTLVTDAGISAIDRLTFNRLGMRVVSANSH